ncbi:MULTISPECIES: hypothetical protein [Bradyrhizobium]
MELAAQRFIVRQGTVGWMVYGRERKGPALLRNGTWAEKLSKEEAERIKFVLANHAS